MASVRTRLLLAAAIFLGAVLFGGIADRVLVGEAAWRAAGAAAWASFSRHADLGNGLTAYPVEAIGATLLSIAAAVSYRFDRPARRDANVPIHLAPLLFVVGLLLTIKAAPIMLGLAAQPDADALERAFEDFHFWGLYLRGAADGLALLAEIWALASLCRADSEA